MLKQSISPVFEIYDINVLKILIQCFKKTMTIQVFFLELTCLKCFFKVNLCLSVLSGFLILNLHL